MYRGILFAVLAGICWGVGELFTKMVLHTGRVGPMAVLVVRTAAALPPALLAYWVAQSVLRSEPAEWWKAGTPTMLKLVLGSALLAGFGGVFFFYLGMANAPITRVKPIAFTLSPAVAVVLGWLVLKEPMNLQKWVGVVLVLVGVVVLTTAGGGESRARAAEDGRASHPIPDELPEG